MTSPRIRTLLPLLFTVGFCLSAVTLAVEPVVPEKLEYERSAPSLGEARLAIENSETASSQESDAEKDEFGISTNARQLLDHIADSRAHGLNPEAYNLDYLEQLSGSLRVNLSSAVPGSTNTSTIKLRSELKKHLNNSFALFVTHLGVGMLLK